jgi:hypothetical protein
VHDWQAKALFISSFLLGLIVWPDVNGWADFWPCAAFLSQSLV